MLGVDADAAGGDSEPEAPEQTAGSDFFERNTQPRAEIIEGTIREGQLVVVGGPFGVGKTPLLIDCIIHVLNGLEWLGRMVQQRPVIVFDFESSGPKYRQDVKNIARRLGVAVPRVPDELELYLQNDPATEPATAKLLSVLTSKLIQDRLNFVEEALQRKPNALVTIDPLEMLFRIDTGKKTDILWLYQALKLILARYPHAALLSTFNMRKQDRKAGQKGLPDLLSNPRAFLEEVCGSLDIHNRSDVRLGMDVYGGDDRRVINGIRRGEHFDPLLVRPVEHLDSPAGFELAPPSDSDLTSALTWRQNEHWKNLPDDFAFDDVAEKVVPRASLFRLIKRTQLLGRLRKDDAGRYWKVTIK
jgi:hypothetical protein